MRYAYSTLACPGWSIEQMIEAAARFGYDALEIRLLDGEVLDPVADRGKVEQALTRCRAAGLEVCALDTSCRLYYRGPEEQARQAAELANWIRLAADIGVPLLRVFGGDAGPPGSEQPGELEADARVAEALRGAVREAERSGVTLALETHDIFSSAVRTGRVLSQVDSPAARALWDTLHPHRMGESPGQALAALGARLAHVHIKDARRQGSDASQWRQVQPGEGEVPVMEAVSLLRERGYGGYISVEWEKKWHPELAEPEVALARHIAWLRGLE